MRLSIYIVLIVLLPFNTYSQPLGLFAKLVQAYLTQRDGHSAGVKPTPALDGLEYIESPLQQMKRAGLGLLSQGLGRYVLLY